MLNLLTKTIGLLSIALCAGGIALAHFELAPVTTAMMLYAISGLVGLVAAALAIAVIFTTGDTTAIGIGLAGAIPLVLVFASLAGGLRYPAINDITTDTQNPPAFTAAAALPQNVGRDMDFPPDFAEVITRNYPEIQPLLLDIPPAEAFAQALSIAQESGWTITAQDPQAHTIEAVAITPLFRFRDDISIRISPKDTGSRIDIRSKSRLGKSDLGANAKRIQHFFREFAAHHLINPHF